MSRISSRFPGGLNLIPNLASRLIEESSDNKSNLCEYETMKYKSTINDIIQTTELATTSRLRLWLWSQLSMKQLSIPECREDVKDGSLEEDIDVFPESFNSSSKCLNSDVFNFDIFSDILRLLLKYVSGLSFWYRLLSLTRHSTRKVRRQMRITITKNPTLPRMAISISLRLLKKTSILENRRSK